MIKTLVVDDEPLARAGLNDLLARHADVEVVGECRDGKEALDMLSSIPCDLLFLDVQMPELDGFAVLSALPPEQRPVTIFVTAHDEFALRAFAVHAIDYLTKPVQRHRFDTALDRARAQLTYSGRRDMLQRLEALARSLPSDRRDPILLKTDRKSLLVLPHDIERIEAEGNYARIHMRGGAVLIRETMNALQERLPDAQFARVHRSHLINIGHTREVVPMIKGDFTIRMASGAAVPLSRKYRPLFEARFRQKL